MSLLQDDKARLDSKDQKSPQNVCTTDATSVDPPASSSAPGDISPYSPSSAEMTSPGSSSPSVDSSPHPDLSSSPLTLLTSAVATWSTHPDLLSSVPHQVTRPSPSSTSPCTPTCRRSLDYALGIRLAHLDQERQRLSLQENPDFWFAAVVQTCWLKSVRSINQ